MSAADRVVGYVRWFLTIPDRMIEKRSDIPSLKWEFIVIMISCLLGAVGWAIVLNEAHGAMEGENEQIVFSMIGQALQPSLVILGTWMLFALSTHIIGNRMGSRAPAIRMVRTSAWAMVPLGIWNGVKSALVWWAYEGYDWPAQPPGLGPSEEFPWLIELPDDPAYGQTSWRFQLIFLAGIVLVVWSWKLLTQAVQYAQGFPHEQARRIAAVPVVLFIVYMVYRLVTTSGLV